MNEICMATWQLFALVGGFGLAMMILQVLVYIKPFQETMRHNQEHTLLVEMKLQESERLRREMK